MELRLMEQARGCSQFETEAADSRCVLVFCLWHSGGGECLPPPRSGTLQVFAFTMVPPWSSN